MKNIYIDNTQIHSNSSNIGFFVFPKIQGLESPSLRIPSFTRPNVDGAFVPNQLYGGRLITFRGKVFADDITTYRTRRRTFETATKIKRVSGALTPLVLKFTTMDDFELQTDVYTRRITFDDQHLLHGSYRVDFLAPSIYLLSQSEKSQDIYIFSGGGMGIPMGIPMDMSTEGVAEAELTNSGNVDSFPDLVFHGPMINPTLTNVTNGDALSITKTMTTTDERIEIDTVNRTSLYYATPTGSGTNNRSEVSGDFMVLQSGANTVKLTTGAYNTTGYVHIAWRDSFSGV